MAEKRENLIVTVYTENSKSIIKQFRKALRQEGITEPAFFLDAMKSMIEKAKLSKKENPNKKEWIQQNEIIERAKNEFEFDFPPSLLIYHRKTNWDENIHYRVEKGIRNSNYYYNWDEIKKLVSKFKAKKERLKGK